MKKRISIILVYLLFLIICQPVNLFSRGVSINNDIVTEFGVFRLTIPTLRLPKINKIPLVSFTKVDIPNLPNWYHSRFIPDDPSWLDNSGKFYKEGIVNMYSGNIELAFKRFKDFEYKP